MLTTTLTTLLTLAPPPELPLRPFVSQLDHVEYVSDGESVELIAHDEHGTVIGVVAMFVEPNGDLRLVSEYDDGYADISIDDEGDAHVATNLPAEAVERRAKAIVDRIATTETPPQEGWALCAAKVLISIAACMGPHYVWTCGPTAFIAACECIPLVIPDDWEYQEC